MTDFDLQRTVAEVALRPIGRVSGLTTLGECARLLSTRFDALIAFEPVRMISARDVVTAVARQQSAATPVDELDLEHAYCVPATTSLAEVLPSIIDSSSRRVIVQAADGRLLGRLTLAAVARGLFERSPWIDAFQFALHIERPARMEIEQ